MWACRKREAEEKKSLEKFEKVKYFRTFLEPKKYFYNSLIINALKRVKIPL
jgi:hypothetical protein